MYLAWIFFPLLSALFLSLCDCYSKKLSAFLSIQEIALARNLVTLPFLWLVACCEGIPVFNPELIVIFSIAIPIELTAYFLYLSSIAASPLSLTVPFLSFTPVFLLLTSFLIMGETVSYPGAAGIVLIVAGAYSLNIRGAADGLSAPFRMIFSEKGSWMMLIASMLYSVTAVFGKKGILLSSPAFFMACYYTLLSVPIAAAAVRRGSVKRIFNKKFLIMGVFSSLSALFHAHALTLAPVSLIIAIKRSSILISIVLGGIYFRETGMKERVAAGAVMVLGILVISIWGKA